MKLKGTDVAPTDNKIVSIVDDGVDIAEIFQDTLSTKMEGTSLVSFNDPAIALDHYKKTYMIMHWLSPTLECRI